MGSPEKAFTRVLLVDDNQMVRSLIKNRLASLYPSWEICEVKSGCEALEQTVVLKPEIAMLDLSLPDMLGETVARQIRQLSPATKIVLCSLNDSGILAQIAEKLEADAFISKVASEDEFRAILTPLIPATPGAELRSVSGRLPTM
jgi:two-component system response regulator YesN